MDTFEIDTEYYQKLKEDLEVTKKAIELIQDVMEDDSKNSLETVQKIADILIDYKENIPIY